jgi:hypothetical protein
MGARQRVSVANRSNMEGQQLPPLWVGPELEKFFVDHVAVQYMHPDRFDAQLAPLSYCQAVFGRAGLEKCRAVQQLAAAHCPSLSVECVTVEFGKTTQAMATIDQHFASSREVCAAKGSGAIVSLLVIDRADILVYEPDNEETMLRAIRIKKRAEKLRVMVLCLFDRTPGDTNEGHRMTAWGRECHERFFAQFEPYGYHGCPDAEYRKAYFWWYFERFAAHRQRVTGGVPIPMALDFDQLADFSIFATPLDLRRFCHKIGLAVTRDPDAPKHRQLDMSLVRAHVNGTTQHICAYDPREVENRFRMLCHRGPEVANKQQPTAEQPQPPLKRPKLNITGFTKEGADFDFAANKLGIDPTTTTSTTVVNAAYDENDNVKVETSVNKQ